MPWKESYDQPRQHIQKQRHYFANKGPSSQGSGFSSGHVWIWELYYKESWMPKNWCFWTVVLEKTLESPLDCKEIQLVHPKGDQSWVFIGRTWCWSWNSNTLATWCEELTHLKRPWFWERLRAGGEGYNRGWDGWMALLTQWTWVWVNSGSWWWTGRPGVLQFMESQRVRLNWATELKLNHFEFIFVCDVRECTNSFGLHVAVQLFLFIELHVTIQLSQHGLLNILSSVHYMFLPLLLLINWQ